MRNLVKNFLILLSSFLILAGLFSMASSPVAAPKRVDIGTLLRQLADGQVKTVVVRESTLELTLQDGSAEVVAKEAGESFGDLVKNYGLAPDTLEGVRIEVREREGVGFWLGVLLPFLIPFLLISVFIYYMMRQVQGANSRAMMFGQSHARQFSPEHGREPVTFKDVAGTKEAKEELLEVVEFLRQPKRFLALGARIPKGVLLVGPPGTGKTLLARAVAGEANVPFFNISGSEFVEMFVGVGASRVRDLFRKAKRAAPCIVFVDELDAVGRQRGAGLGGSNDEREQTLNQILVEMDGFDATTNVIILAATNRPDVLDAALLRPGRFDRQVVIDMPDMAAREEILRVHAKGKPVDPAVNLREIAEHTPGFTGADLANLMNEAALLTARRDKTVVGKLEILQSIEKVLLGPERRSHIMDAHEKKITAYHEAGHALVSHELPGTDPVRKVSIISRGSAAGYTLKLPEKDKYMRPRSEYVAELAVMLAGYEAETAIFGQVTTGASNDLRKATHLAQRMIMEFGMSDKLGPRTFGEREELIFLGRSIHEQRDFSEKVAEMIDAEVTAFIELARQTARRIITTQRERLDTIAKVLMEKETIEREEFEALFKPAPPPASAPAASPKPT